MKVYKAASRRRLLKRAYLDYSACNEKNTGNTFMRAARIDMLLKKLFFGVCYLMFGSSRPSPFFLSTTLRIKPMASAATPSPASITRGAV